MTDRTPCTGRADCPAANHRYDCDLRAAIPAGWTYRTIHGAAFTHGRMWFLVRDGLELGTISFLDEAGWRPELLVQDAVFGLNHPIPLEQRRFAGPALAIIDEHRARRAAAQDRHPSQEPGP